MFTNGTKCTRVAFIKHLSDNRALITREKMGNSAPVQLIDSHTLDLRIVKCLYIIYWHTKTLTHPVKMKYYSTI